MSTGIVAIGRNEGSRLAACLRSIRDFVPAIVYVDSGSQDDSVALARGAGADVVELDLRTPFTAARARNAGFTRLIELHPDLEFVFFVDGDCEVADGWMSAAVAFIREHADVAVVCGIRRERYPQRSIYNRLCDIEWQSAPFGDTKACGGDALIRTLALQKAGGYDAALICGEEPDLCIRLRSERLADLAQDTTGRVRVRPGCCHAWRAAGAPLGRGIAALVAVGTRHSGRSHRLQHL
jgi:glycosyltransferase involved in cell wall biosynthesis